MKKSEESKQKRSSVSSNTALGLFHKGSSAKAYEYFGAHQEGDHFVFRVWSPHADYVAVCGDFTDWRQDVLPMRRVTDHGVWEAVTEATQIKEGQRYKYFIRNGCRELYKADPYGVAVELPPENATVICDIGGYRWRDAGWMRYRKGRFTREAVSRQPINIYELHAGSWKRHEDGSFYSYTDLAADLVTYVKQMGYTHVELMPLAEHPSEDSWGYRVCGHYASTSRYGDPKELMAFVDVMHEAGIGVILDWVPAHFSKDAQGLFEFDGQPLYEYREVGRMENPVWGTRCFDVGRPEVQSFLISNAYFWIEQFHVDGLRVGAVSSMLYLDYDRAPGEWTPNEHGDNRNLEAIAFFQKLNVALRRDHPDVMTIAEEALGWADLTRFENGGLGFTFGWNVGWRNGTLFYQSEDPLFRKHHHEKITASLNRSFAEHFVLPLSHDEVVHGKCSLAGRCCGDQAQKLANVRVLLAYTMTHPGKKLMFMGGELGQPDEWDHSRELDWSLLAQDMHADLQLFTAELNHFYLEHAALWQCDGDPSSFSWIDPENRNESIFSYRRRDERGRELIVLLNFTPVRRDGFLLAVPDEGNYEEVFNTDAKRYGGTGCVNGGTLHSEPCPIRGYEHAIRINVPPMGAVIYRCVRRAARHKKAAE